MRVGGGSGFTSCSLRKRPSAATVKGVAPFWADHERRLVQLARHSRGERRRQCQVADHELVPVHEVQLAAAIFGNRNAWAWTGNRTHEYLRPSGVVVPIGQPAADRRPDPTAFVAGARDD